MKSTRKKSGQPVGEPIGLKAEETASDHVRGTSTPTKMCRGYSVKVRGELPDDIVERISELHSVALRAGG